MIKLKNIEISKLLSADAQRLFSEKSFPLEAGFKIHDILKSAERSIDIYRAEYRKIISKYNGELLETGDIRFEDASVRLQASTEIEALNNIELEFPGEKIMVNDDWPKLTIFEIDILTPLIA